MLLGDNDGIDEGELVGELLGSVYGCEDGNKLG